MATVNLVIAGRVYDLACRDGEEPRLQMLAAMLDEKAGQAARAVGDLGEARQLLLAALLLADELADLRAVQPGSAPPPPAPSSAAAPEVVVAIQRLAARLETLAARLEEDVTNA